MSAGALSVALSFFAATVAWLVFEFVGRPFRRFFDLRGEVIYVLTVTANVRERTFDQGARYAVMALFACLVVAPLRD